MQFELKNPYKTLPTAGYFMVGRSNQFKRHINEITDKPFKWFHCFIDHDDKVVKIHVDKAKNQKTIPEAYRHHKTDQRTKEIKKEIERIKIYEFNWIEKIIYKLKTWK